MTSWLGVDNLNAKDIVLAELTVLFEKAECEDLWFYNQQNEIWLSPEELKEQIYKGEYIWGAANWQLLDPQVRLEQLHIELESLENQIHSLEERMGKKSKGKVVPFHLMSEKAQYETMQAMKNE